MTETNPFIINEKAFLNNSSQSNTGEVVTVLPPLNPVEDDETEDKNDISYGSLGLKMEDSYNPFKGIDPVAWLESPESRSQQIDQSISRMRDGLMTPDARVPSLSNGEIEQVPASLAGRLTPAGMHAFDNAMQILSMAEQDSEGGYRVNQMTNENVPVFGSKYMTPFDPSKNIASRNKNTKDITIGDNTYKVKTITPDQVGSEEHVRAILSNYKLYTGDDPLKSDYFNIDGLINWRDSIKNNSMPVTPWNADSVTQILDTKDVKIDDKIKSEMSSVLDRLKAEANMPQEKLVDMYKGQPIFNYAEIKDLNELELQFSNLKMPKADKARLLASFRTNFESSAGELMSQAVEGGKTWDYMMNFIPNVAVANLAGADIGFNNEDKLLQGISEGRSYYDMVKSGTIDVDRNWLQRTMEKTAMSTLASFQNTGTGFGFLIAKGLGNVAGIVSEDAEKAFDRGAGYMAEAASITQDAKRQYYKNIGSSEIKIGSITISSDDIYDLAGNILETISTGGISSAAKLGAKGLSTAATRTATMGVARNIGKESAKKIAQEAVEAGVKRGAIKNGVASLKEQAKSLWLNSAAVGKAESVLATSLHGSFTSAGGALSEGMSKGLDEAAMKGLSGNEATEYAANKATGYGLVNGVATFVMMTAMNSIAPGIEKILVAPEDGLSLFKAISNSVANKTTRKSISGLLKEVITDASMRKTIVKGIANEIGDTVAKNGVTKFMGGVLAGTASEFIEEAGDTALALAGEAYLLQDKDARKLLEQGGYWTEVLKAGVLGALGGIASGTFQTTSEGNKKSIKATMDAMDAYKQTLPDNIKAKMGASISVKSDTSESGRRIDTIKNILATGSVTEKVDALTNIGQSIALEVGQTGQPASQAPNPLEESTIPTDQSAPKEGETPTTLDGESKGKPSSQKPNVEGQSASAPTDTIAAIAIKNTSKVNLTINAPTTSENLAKYAHKQSHGTDADVGTLVANSKINDVVSDGQNIPVTTYVADGKPADIHSFAAPNGTTVFSSRANLGAKIKEAFGSTVIDARSIAKINPKNEIAPILVESNASAQKESPKEKPEKKESNKKPAKETRIASMKAEGERFDKLPRTDDVRKSAMEAMKRIGAMGIARNGEVYVDEDLIREDYDKGMPYIQGLTKDSNGNQSQASKQKEVVFKEMGISAKELLEFFDGHGGADAYINFIKAHEMAHIDLKHGETKLTGGLMAPEAIAREIETNKKAFEKIGFYEWQNENALFNKSKSSTAAEKNASKPKTTTPQLSILERTNSSSQEVLGDGKIPEGAVKNYYNKIKTALQRLNTSIIFVNNLSELSEHGFTPEEIAENEGNPAFTAPMGGSRNKDLIVIDLSQIENAEDFDTAIKHEHFHTFQLAYNRTPAGKLLTEKAAKEVAGNVAVEAFMEKEYYSYSSLSVANKFYEFTRAFVSGKINGQTMGKMGLPNTLEWLKQFLSFSKKQIKRNPDMTTYFNGLEAEYLKAVKANKELFNYKAGATESFKNWVQGILSSTKVKKPKVKGRIVSTRSASEEEMNSLIAEIRSAIRDSITSGEQIDASDILSFIKNEVENHKLDLDVGLSPLSKANAYRAIVKDWSDNELTSSIKEDLETAAQSLLVHGEPMLGEPVSVQMSAQVKEKIDYSQYTNITKFIREDKVLPVETPKEIIAAASDADRQFSNAQVKGEIDEKSGLAVSIGLNRGDIVEVQGLGTGDVKNLLIFSHTEIITDSNGEKTVLHRFLKASSMMNGKVTNFGKTVQSNMSEKFVREFKDSDLAKTLLTANDGQIKISNPIDLLRFVFDSLVSNSTLIEGGKPAKFDDLFNLVAGSPAGATSPFSYTNRKITVDVLKLQQDFAKIDSNLLENPDTAETITLLIAQTVRTAVEEELLHHVTTSVFTNQQLVDFYDDLAGLPQFNILRGQIMAQQGITNPQDALTELDKIVISTEFLSFIHQKSLDGATYGDQYAQLMDIATSFATSDTARAVATSYGKRFKDILGARAASAYMSPRMIDMLKKLTSVKVEAGMRRDGTGYESLYAQYNAERYNEARSRFQSSIDQAFIQQSASVNDLRTFLRDSSINERQILDFDTEKEIVSLTPSFRKFYAEKIGDEAMKELDDYFNRLNSSNAVGGLIDSVRAARAQMDANFDILTQNTDADKTAMMAVNQDFDGLLKMLEANKGKDGWISAFAIKAILEDTKNAPPQLIRNSESGINYSLFTNIGKGSQSDSEMTTMLLYNNMVNNGLINQTPLINPDLSRVISELNQAKIRYDKREEIVPRNNKRGGNLTNEKLKKEYEEAQEKLIKAQNLSRSSAMIDSMAAAINSIIPIGSSFEVFSSIYNSVSSSALKLRLNQENKKNKAIELLDQMSSTGDSVTAYWNYAKSIKDYNDLVLNYAEIVLNKNLNEVDEFGRTFDVVGTEIGIRVKDNDLTFVQDQGLLTENTVPNIQSALFAYEPNVFGYQNQSPDYAITARGAKRDILEKTDIDIAKNDQSFVFGYIGRYTSDDRKNFTDKVLRIESNAAFLGESEYNSLVLARINGEQITIGSLNQTYSDFSRTMGFNPIQVKQSPNGDVTPTALNNYLNKMVIPDTAITIAGADGESSTIRKMSSSGRIKNAQFPLRGESALTQAVNILFKESAIDSWIGGLQDLIGYDPTTGATSVVNEIAGKQSFASKFAQQVAYRIYGGGLIVGSGVQEKLVGADGDTLYGFIREYRNAYYSFNSGLTKPEGVITKSFSPAEIADLIQRLPTFLEAIDALNQDIGLARKAYSRFTSKYVSNTILGDIRLIQEQGADGIRANEELLKAIKNSYYDIQGMDNVEFEINQINQGGQIGIKGMSALELMNSLVTVPESAQNEYHVVNLQSEKAKQLADYYSTFEEVGLNLRGKDADGKTGFALDNLIFNVVQRIGDRPDEADVNFNEDQDIKASQADEATSEALDAYRRKQLHEEVKRLKSWTNQAGLSIFQSVAGPLGQQRLSGLNPMLAKRFFSLFAKAANEEYDFYKDKSTYYTTELTALVRDQMIALGSHYKIGNEVDPRFLKIASNVMSYGHPLPLLMDVIEIIAEKERSFLAELNAASELLGDVALAGLTKQASLTQRVVPKKGTKKAESLNASDNQAAIEYLEKELYTAEQKLNEAETNPFGESTASFKQDIIDIKKQIDELKSILIIEPETINPNAGINQRAAENILGSLREDIEKGQLVTGTLFKANTFKFKSDESMASNDLLLNSPLFSALIQAMPNLLIYQPNDQYEGKNTRVPNDIEFAQFGDGEGILYIGNAYAMPASKQAEILERLLIAQIRRESVNGTQASVLQQVISDAAKVVREQASYALNLTPERIESMVDRASSAITSVTKLDNDAKKMLIDKYRDSLQAQALQSISLLGSHNSRNKYVQDELGMKSEMVSDFFAKLVNQDGETGVQSVLSDIQLIIGMLTNPDAYRLLNNLKAPEVTFEAKSLDSKYNSMLERALGVLGRPEITGSELQRIALEKINQQDTGDDEIDFEIPVFAEDILASIEENFLSEQEKPTRKISLKDIKRNIKRLSPDFTRNVINELILKDMSETSRMFGTQAELKDALVQTIDQTNFLYRYVASNLINALNNSENLVQQTIEDMSMPSAGMSVFEQLKSVPASNANQALKDRAFPVLMDSIGNPNVSARGNLTDYYYNNSPTTEVFSMRRKNHFAGLLVGKTPAMQYVLNQLFETTSQGKDFDKINRMEYAIDLENENYPNLLGLVQEQLADLIGRDLLNEAIDNVDRNIENAENSKRDARIRKAELERALDEARATGTSAMLEAAASRSKELVGASDELLLQMSDKVGDAIYALKKNAANNSHPIHKAILEQKERLDLVNRAVTGIADIDKQISTALANKNTSESVLNQQLQTLVSKRNTLAKNANLQLTNFIANTTQTVISTPGFKSLKFEDTKSILGRQLGENIGNMINIQFLDASTLGEQGISVAEYLQLNRDRMLTDAKRKGISGKIKEIQTFEFSNNIAISAQSNQGIVEYANQVIEEQISKYKKTPDVAALFSRLNKGNQIEKAVNALMKNSEIQEATTLQRTKALVMQALTQNPSLQKTIAEEVAFDSIENVVESGIETGGRDAFGNVIENMSTEIEMLADEIDRLQAILDAPDADFLSENKKLFKIQHSVPFKEQEALKRMSNGNSPVFKMDLILSVEKLPDNPSDKAKEDRQNLLNRIRNINEAIRLFVERDGSLMYRTLTEEVEIYGEGFDVRQNIDNAIKLAELKNSLDQNDQRKFDKLSSEASRVDEMFNKTDPLAIELFGISLRDMEALGLEPVVADLPDDQEETDEQKAQRQLKVTKKYKNDRERLMGTALFIKDQHGISVYSPTEGKLGSTESKTYLVMNRNARQELQRFKQATKATWSVNEALKDVVFRAAKNVSIEQGLLRTQAGEDIDINLNEPISKELANATGVDPATTIKEFQKIAKERFNSFFLKQQLNKEIGEFAKGIGIIGTIKPIEKLDDAEISAIFDDVLAFASNPANAKTLQNAGFGFAPKTSVTYTSEQKKTIVADAIQSVVKENKFLDPSNNLTAALIANEALLEDVINMLHTSKLKNQEIDGIYDNHVLEGIKSIASLFVNADKVAEATSRKGYSVNTAIRNLDLHQNYTRLYSVLYGESTLKDLIAGVQNPKQSQNTWNEMTVHENAEIRQKFGKSYGSYQKALRMLGILDHGISGASGRNQYAAKYQEFQDRVGKASKSIGTSYSKGAKAYLVASLRGILVANEQDGGNKEKVGIKLYQWATAFDRGMIHHNQLLKNRNKKRESLGFVKKGLESANSGVRKQLREDNDVAEISKLIESEIKQITYYTNLSNITPEIAETFINQIEQKLLNGYTSEEISEINNYSSVLLQEFEDISNAHRIANTFASEAPHRNIDDWMNRESEDVSSALKRSYSIMPLRFGYSKNPLDTNDDKGESEAVPISDFTSFEKSLMNYKGSTLRESIDDREGKTKIFRPIDLNPFTAPDQLASDALYRTAVTPSYMILKKLLGAVTDDGTGAQKITKHGHLNQAIARDAAILSESKAGNYPYIAAYLMGTIEKTIRNDMPKNLYDNYAADILRASTTAIFVKTLLSVWQPILNGIVPAIGKMATVSMLNNRGVINKSPRILAECYWMAFKGYFGKDSELVKFTKENSINSYKWKAEGSQTRDTQISETKYGGQSNLLYWSRKFLAKTRNIGEKALDFTIGQPERAMVQSIFAFELFHQLKDEMGEDRAPKTIAEMLSMNPDEISTLAKTRADIMVTDFMGLGDRAKKAGLFNIETRSATIGLLLAGATRYGNHSMTVGANMMVNGQQIWNSKISKKDGWNDPEMVDLAIENAVGTVVQNTLFFLARAQIAVPTILWIASLAVSALGGDDEEKEEETSERTIRWLRKLQTSDELESDGLMSRAGRFAREQILPGEFNVTKKEFIKKSGGYDDALRVNLYTGVRDSMLDLISGLPGVGATLAVPIVGDQVKSVITNTAKAAAPKDAKWMDIMVDRSNGVFDPVTQPIVSPIESGRNFSGIFLNRFAPKDGRKGTDNADFIEGIYNSTIGTREGIRTYYKRAEKKGGWGAYGPPS